MPDPVAPAVRLTDEERAQLVAWSRRATSANALAVRSRIVLAAAEGMSTSAVARRLDVSVGTARRWRARFVGEGLDGLLDEPRPGRPRTVADEQVEAVITQTLETTPKDAAIAGSFGLVVMPCVCRPAGLWRFHGGFTAA